MTLSHNRPDTPPTHRCSPIVGARMEGGLHLFFSLLHYHQNRMGGQQYRKGILDALEFVLYDTERLQKVKRDLWDNSKVEESEVSDK